MATPHLICGLPWAGKTTLAKRLENAYSALSSGAHPRWARNTGSGESIATATKLCIANHEIWHDPDHPSAIALPIS